MYTKEQIAVIKQVGDVLAQRIQSEDEGDLEKFQGIYLTLFPESVWEDDPDSAVQPRLADWQVWNMAKLLYETAKTIDPIEAARLKQKMSFVDGSEYNEWCDLAQVSHFRDLAVIRVQEVLAGGRVIGDKA